MSVNSPSRTIGQTTTSIARLAASREVFDTNLPSTLDGKEVGDLRFSFTGFALENIQGPIPELSGETPNWLEVYGQVGSSSTTNQSVRSRSRPHPNLPNAHKMSSPMYSRTREKNDQSNQLKQSPYSQKPKMVDNLKRNQPSAAFPVISFSQVYGKHNQDMHPKDEYAAALKSLTSMGFEDDQREDDSSLEKINNLKYGSNGLKLTSKFATKEEAHTIRRTRAGGEKFVSGGLGFMTQATSESVLASIRRMHEARAKQAALDAAEREANKPKVEKEEKEKKEKPPTVRTSVQFEDGSKYRGDWSTRGLGAHGQGLLNFTSGDKYVGGFKRHMFEGFGTYYYANGDKYEGPWRKGEKHGEKGKFSRQDGTVLEVSWKNDRANGHGVCKYPSGARFVGEYRNDVKEGLGCYTSPNGDEYKGDFKHDKILGQGIFIDKKNGTSYSGSFNNSKRNGKKDESAEFTLHHGLFGDFSFHGGKQGGEEHPGETVEQTSLPTPGTRKSTPSGTPSRSN